MPHWLKRLFSEPHTLSALLPSALDGLVVSVVHGIVEKRHGGWTGFARALLTGISVSVIVGLGIEGFVSSETLRLAIVGGCAVVSEDIWVGLRTLGATMRRDPFGFLFRVMDALRGREPAPRPRTSQSGNTAPAPLEPLERGGLK